MDLIEMQKSLWRFVTRFGLVAHRKSDAFGGHISAFRPNTEQTSGTLEEQ